MIYNNLRQRVKDWEAGQPSKCPDCGAALVAKRGDIVTWHWAHKAKRTTGSTGCYHEESPWHLRFKEVYEQDKSWAIEVPLSVGGNKFRIDAIRKDRREIRELVHTLSPQYMGKHLALVRGRFNVLWIIDGEKFASARRKKVANGGIKYLLKPIVRDFCKAVGFHVLVHFENQFWKHWDHDVWFPKVPSRVDAAALNLYPMRVSLDQIEPEDPP